MRINYVLNKDQIIDLLHMLNDELAQLDVIGQLHLVGGAVMCMSLNARPATKDLDAHFQPAQQIREAAARIASRENLPRDWLNDAVKGFLGERGDWSMFLDLEYLKMFIATPEYMLAMKAAAMRIGEGFQDEDDVRYILRYLNISDYDKALEVITRYFDLQALPQKTLYALEEMTQC